MLLLACAPIVLTVVLIAVRRPALHAALIGIVLTLVLIATSFPVAGAEIPALLAKWVPVVLEVFIIIGGGILLATANRVTGRQSELAGWVQQTLGTGTGAALAVVHGVAPFAESLTGFGIGVTVAVFKDVGIWSGIVSGPVFIAVGLVAAWLTSISDNRFSSLAAGVVSALVLWGAILGSNLIFGSAPAGALGAMLTFCLHLLVHKVRGAKLAMNKSQVNSLAGYLILLAGVMALTVFFSLTGLKDTPWHYFASPSLWLFIAVLTTTPKSYWPQVFSHTMKPWKNSGSVTALFLVLGILMSVSGMSLEIARGLEKFGTFYAALSPIIAGAGGYLTGSNSASNAMFSVPQAEAFVALGLPAVFAMGIQNTCASMLTMASPSRVELSTQMCPNPVEAKTGIGIIYATCAVTMLVFAVGCFGLALLV